MKLNGPHLDSDAKTHDELRTMMVCLSWASGAHLYSAQLANSLRDRCRIAVCVPHNIDSSILGMYNKDIEIYRIWMAQRSGGRISPDTLKGIVTARTIRSFSSATREFNPCVLHIVFEGWIQTLFLFKKSIASVSTIHDPTPHKDSDSPLERLRGLIQRWASDAIIVHGEILRNGLPSGRDKAHVIPIGNTGIYYDGSSSNAEEKSTVLFFGRILEYKGLRYLIQAVPLIVKQVPELKVIIAGEGSFQDEEEVRMDSHFELIHRFIKDEEIPSIFGRCSLVVLPYEEATQSGIIPLAYYFGKPVVATSVGALPEVVVDGDTGILVPPKNVESLAQAIVRLLRDDDERRSMGAKAHEFAMKELSWDTIASKTYATYVSVLKRTR